MLLREAKDKVYMLLDEHSAGGEVEHDEDIELKMTRFFDTAQKQLAQIEKFKRLENKKLSADMEYSKIDGLRIEAQQKLDALKPVSIGQASRISGVSPADINVLLIYLEKQRRSRG